MTEKQLNDRAERILKDVVETFIMTGTPVGSRVISKLPNYDISPATIRNTMLELEEMNYLYQPHTSAGRMPTDSGYRFFVDTLLENDDIQQVDIPDNFFETGESSGFPVLMEKVSKVLSNLSDNIGIVLAPSFVETVLKHIEFVNLGGSKILAVIVTKLGAVHNKVISVEKEYTQRKLDEISSYIVERFVGKTLKEIRSELIEKMADEKSAYDDLLKDAILTSKDYFEKGKESSVYIEGTSNILSKSDFADIEEMKELFRAFEEKSKIVEILNGCIGDTGMEIVIGSENFFEDLKDLSFVTAPYETSEGGKGLVGIVGPTRMHYPRVISIVDAISSHMNKVVGE